MDLRGQQEQRLHNIQFNPKRNVNTTLPTVLYFAFKILGLIVPLLPIYLGYDLFIMGVTGEASIVINARGINAQMLNAAPGLFFAISGIVALIVSVTKGVKYSA